MSDAEIPASLPTDPQRFYCTTVDFEELTPPILVETTPALERLGPSPFAKTKFPLLGFLETLYEHVAAQAQAALGTKRG